MVPSGVATPRCRPKRAAASKAEGVISEALSGSVDKTDERRAQQADAESEKNAPAETSRPMGWLQQRPAHDAKRVNKGKAKKTSKQKSSQMACTAALAKGDTKLEFSSYSGSRRSHETKAGTKRGRESGDHNPLSSSRGRPTDQIRVKPKPPQGVGGVSCLMKSFATHGGPRFEIPINPTMQDAWKVLDIVLAYLPSTTILSVDTLLHLAGAIPRKEGDSNVDASGDTGGSTVQETTPNQSDQVVSCEGGAPNTGGLPSEAWAETGEPPPGRDLGEERHEQQVVGEQREARVDGRRMGNAKSVFVWNEFDDSKIFRHHQDRYAKEREQAMAGDGPRSGLSEEAGRSYAGAWTGVAELDEDDHTWMVGERCAKSEGLPRGRQTAAELAACEACLSDAMNEVEAVLMRLGAEVEDLRFDPDSEAMQKWTEWETDTIAQYGPLEERTIMERKAQKSKQDEEVRRETLRLQEELQAVCYVCDSGDHSEEDAIVFCERCCVAVHASCYKAVGVHELDKWYCDFCDDLIAKARKRLEEALEQEKRLDGAGTTPLEGDLAQGMEGEKQEPEGDDEREEEDGTSRAPSRSNSDCDSEEPKSTSGTGRTSWISRPTEWPRTFSPLDTDVPGRAVPPEMKPSTRTVSPLDTSPLQVRTPRTAMACRASHSRGHGGRKSPQQGLSDRGAAYSKMHEWGSEPGHPAMNADPAYGPVSQAQSHASPRMQSSPGPSMYSPVEGSVLEDESWIGATASRGISSGLAQAVPSAPKLALSVGAMDRVLSRTRERTLVDDPEERAGAEAAAAAFAAAVASMAGHNLGESEAETMAAGTTTSVSSCSTSPTADVFPAGVSNCQAGQLRGQSVSPQKPLAAPAPTRDPRRAAEVLMFDSAQADDSMVVGEDYSHVLSRGQGSSAGHMRSESGSSAATEENWRSCQEEAVRKPINGNGSPLKSAMMDKDDSADRPRRLPWSPPQHMLQQLSPSNNRRESPRATAGKCLASFERLKNGEIVAPQRDADNLSMEDRVAHEREDILAEVAAARAALKEAEEVVGIDTPSKDKGPREADAVCFMCPVRGGAFHKTDKVRKNGSTVWCHCLCALSNGLPVVDRIVKVKDVSKGHDIGDRCCVCNKLGRGWLISCEEPGCSASFHPLCGNRAGGSADRGPQLPPCKWTARCAQHAVAVASSSDKGDALATAKGRRKRGGDSGRRSSLSGISSDPEMQQFQAEVKESYANRNAACPPGKCHRCRKDRKWTAGCSACSFRFCPTCIASQRESPKAILASVRAMAQSLANRKPPPRDAFLCFVCRDICMCAPCSNQRKKAAAKKAKVEKPARAVPLPAERPKIVRPPKPPRPKSRVPFDRRPTALAGEENGASPMAPEPEAAASAAVGAVFPEPEFGENMEMEGAEGRADESVEIGIEGVSLSDDNDRVHGRDDDGDEALERPRKMSHVDPSLEDVLNQRGPRRSPSRSPLMAPNDLRMKVVNASETVVHTQEMDRCNLSGTRAKILPGFSNVDRPPVGQSRQARHSTSPLQAPKVVGRVGQSLATVCQDMCRDAPDRDASPSLLTEEDAAIFPWMSPEPSPLTQAPVMRNFDSARFPRDMTITEHVNGGEQYGAAVGELAPNGSKQQDSRKANGRRSSMGVNSAPKVVCKVSVAQMLTSQSSTCGTAQPTPGIATSPVTSVLPSASVPGSGISCPSPATSASVTSMDGGSLKGSPERQQVGAGDVFGGQEGTNRAPGIKGVLGHIPLVWKALPGSETNSTIQNNVFGAYGMPAPTTAQPAPGVNSMGGIPLSVPPSAATTASVLNARATRARATQAAAEARKAVEAMTEAKSCSDLNNRAAMWRVQRATKLKDTLLGANDLVSSFGKLKMDAESEVHAAATDETNALSCLRDAEADLRRLVNRVTTLSNDWLTDPALETTGPNPVPPVVDMFRPEVSANGLNVNTPGSRTTTTGPRGGSIVTSSNGVGGHPSNRSASPIGWDASGWWAMDDTPLAAPRSSSTSRSLGTSGMGVTPGHGVSQAGGGLGARAESFDRLEDARERVKSAADAALKARDLLGSKKKALSDLAAGLKRAEDSRANLVTQTQSASDTASKASAAAMQKEEYARVKAEEARTAQETADIAEWDAQKAEWAYRAAAKNDHKNAYRTYFGAFGGSGSSGGPVAAAMGSVSGSMLGTREGLMGLSHVELGMANGDRSQDVPPRQISQHRAL